MNRAQSRARGRWVERTRHTAVQLATYTAALLWHERQRFLAAMLGVTVSAVLISLQWGVVLGIFATTSLPIDHCRADLWIGARAVPSVDAGRRISQSHLARLAVQPGVEFPEIYLLDYAAWVKPDNGKEVCLVIGARLADEGVGAVEELTPDLRARLGEPDTVVVDEADRARLGIDAAGAVGEVNGHRVRVVGLVRGLRSINPPYVFCSLGTARHLLAIPPDEATYLLARCPDPAMAADVVRHLREHPKLSAFTRDEFSRKTRWHWLLKTNAGTITLFTAVLALLVGIVITSQTLYGATVTLLKEYAILRALGITRARIGAYVLTQSLGVGVAGALLALPIVLALTRVAGWLGLAIELPVWLAASVLTLTGLLAVFAGLVTLRALRRMDPITLLR